MLNKSTFCRVLKLIQEQNKIDEEVSRALEKVTDTYVFLNSNNLIYKALDIVLKEAMNDKDDFIGWWLYEEVEKIVYFHDEEIDVGTPEKLYDFLEENYE